MPKHLIVFNPMAAQGKAGKQAGLVEAYLKENQVDYQLIFTERVGHAIELGRQAARDGVEVVVAAGGDGTCNEVMNGLMSAGVAAPSRPTLGVLPVGRGNDFAYGAGIPTVLEAACQALAQGKRKVIDLGKVTGGNFPEGRYFGNGIGLGFDTVVGFEAAKMKRLKGALSYLVAVIKTISLYHTAPVYEVTFDGEVLQQPFLMVSIMNGKRMGGSFLMAPESQPGDGQLDLCLVGQVSQLGIVKLVPHFMKGTQAGHPAVRMAHARKVSIRAIQGSIPAHADGETVCTAGQALAVELHPAALSVIVAN